MGEGIRAISSAGEHTLHTPTPSKEVAEPEIRQDIGREGGNKPFSAALNVQKNSDDVQNASQAGEIRPFVTKTEVERHQQLSSNNITKTSQVSSFTDGEQARNAVSRPVYKVCFTCKSNTPISDFAKCRNGRYGVQAYCYACHRIATAKSNALKDPAEQLAKKLAGLSRPELRKDRLVWKRWMTIAREQLATATQETGVGPLPVPQPNTPAYVDDVPRLPTFGPSPPRSESSVISPVVSRGVRKMNSDSIAARKSSCNNDQPSVTRKKSRKLPWLVSEAMEATLAAQTHCAISGIEFDDAKFVRDRNGRRHFIRKSSVDRIDSCVGYTDDNVQMVLSCANTAKGMLPMREFLVLCRAVTAFNKPKLAPKARFSHPAQIDLESLIQKSVDTHH